MLVSITPIFKIFPVISEAPDLGTTDVNLGDIFQHHLSLSFYSLICKMGRFLQHPGMAGSGLPATWREWYEIIHAQFLAQRLAQKPGYGEGSLWCAPPVSTTGPGTQ